MFISFSSMGTSPNEMDKERFQGSGQFNQTMGFFQNLRPERMRQAEEEMDGWAILRKWVIGGEDTTPKEKLAEETPDLVEFLKPGDDIKSIWFGHSTFLLNMNNKIILVDPVFSDYAAPVNFLAKRFQDPVLKLEELPQIDYILISHDHYDHLDMESIKHFRSTETRFITPLGVGSHLVGWGISRSKIIEKDWWESEDLGDIKFTATPAQHFSGRGFSDKNETLWASWVIQTKDHKVFFSGDSGYDTHFKDIGDKYGPFDVAYIESGQYNEMWAAVHMSPEEGVKAFKDLRARKYFPVHWGMFKLALHSWYEPIERLYQYSRAEGFELIAPKLGQLVNINSPRPLEPWWQQNALSEFGDDKLSLSPLRAK